MKKRFVFLLLLAFSMAVVLPADPQVGSVMDISGDVRIDAFGKGVFIKAIKGDVLYAASAIATGPDGRAAIEVQGRTQQIPPGASIALRDLLTAAQKKRDLGWFAALGSLIQSFSAPSQRKGEEVVLGSRAAEVGNGTADDEWIVEETDAATLLSDARADIGGGAWVSALARLEKAAPPADPAVAWSLAFWKGTCLYQIGDYGDAAAALSPAYEAMRASRVSPAAGERRILLFQLGSSWFLLGQEKRAVPLFEALVADRVEDGYQPYAHLLLARSLKESGDAGRSRSVAREAADKYRGTGLEGELAALAQ